MARKILVISLVGIIVSGLLFSTFASPSQAQVLAQPMPSDAGQRILQATVQITMLRDEIVETEIEATGENTALVSRQQISTVAHGIGTLVNIDGQVVMVTHNHWPQVVDNSRPDRVQFFDAQGNRLLEIDGVAFQSNILYRDGGTLVMQAPQELVSQLVPVSAIGDYQNVAPGDTVHVVRHQPGDTTTVGFLAAQVTAIEEDSLHSVMMLQSSDGQTIVPGDSGGGIWIDGTLVGNMWMTIQEQHYRDDSPTPKATVTTDRSRAAGLTEDLLSLVQQSLDNLLESPAVANEFVAQ